MYIFAVEPKTLFGLANFTLFTFANMADNSNDDVLSLNSDNEDSFINDDNTVDLNKVDKVQTRAESQLEGQKKGRIIKGGATTKRKLSNVVNTISINKPKVAKRNATKKSVNNDVSNIENLKSALGIDSIVSSISSLSNVVQSIVSDKSTERTVPIYTERNYSVNTEHNIPHNSNSSVRRQAPATITRTIDNDCARSARPFISLGDAYEDTQIDYDFNDFNLDYLSDNVSVSVSDNPGVDHTMGYSPT